jgi:RsiW-degrading membrane proteinase PrsW (M82 family)
MLLALLISLMAAVVPTFAYVGLFYWADRYEREPLWLAAVAFIWGAIPAIIMSLIVEVFIGAPFVTNPDSLAEELVSGAVVAPVVEEVAKALALLAIFFWKRHEFDGVLDGIMYGALVGFGFAMTENFFYFVGAFDQGGYGGLTVLIILRAVVFGLNHAFYTGLTGLGLGLARNRARRAPLILLGLAAAIVVHALHNFGAGITAVFAAGFGLSLIVAGLGLALTLVAVGLSWQYEQNIVLAELTPEVGRLVSQQELDELTGRWRNPQRVAKPQSMRHRRQLLVEYALRKRRLARRGASAEPGLTAQLDELAAALASAAVPSVATPPAA